MSAVLRPCRGSKGFQGVPDHNLKLNLSTLSSILNEDGFKEKVCVDLITVLEKNGLEYTIYPSGKFLIKPGKMGGVLSLERAENEANELLQLFGKCR